MSVKKIAFFGIDFQVDFCQPGAALFVAGAENDVKRVKAFIENNKEKIDFLCLTQDSHQIIDISHPAFWQDKNGKSPSPFTIISPEHVKTGEWTPVFAAKEALTYLEDLEKQGEFPHCIWPEHCIVGSGGAAIDPILMEAVYSWARQGKFFQIIQKGQHPLTEHFGAFRANIPIMNQPSTQINQQLIKTLEKYDEIYFTGEARSHCVANTLKQAMEYPELAKKFIILDDCMSNVSGFETLADPIYENARNLGISFVKSTDVKL